MKTSKKDTKLLREQQLAEELHAMQKEFEQGKGKRLRSLHDLR